MWRAIAIGMLGLLVTDWALFAQLDATGWTVVIGAFFIGLGQTISIVLAYKRERDKIAREDASTVNAARRDQAIADKVEEVKNRADQVAKIVASKAEDVRLEAGTAARKVDEVARKVQDVAVNLISSTTEAKDTRDKTLKTVEIVHTLVNSDMHVALASNAALAHRIAAMPGATEADKAASGLADRKLNEHDAKQDKVDRGDT